MKKIIALALAAAGSLLATGAAYAGNVYWSVGISAPPIGTVISNAPVYFEPAPVYVQPAPVYVAPPPVYVEPSVYVAPSPVYYVPRHVHYRPVPVYAPRPVVMRPADFVHGGWHGEWREEHRWNDQRRYRHD